MSVSSASAAAVLLVAGRRIGTASLLVSPACPWASRSEEPSVPVLRPAAELPVGSRGWALVEQALEHRAFARRCLERADFLGGKRHMDKAVRCQRLADEWRQLNGYN